MGLHIRVFKPIERVTEAEAADDDVRLLNEVRNIPPGSKNLEVGTGYYRCQEVEVPTFHIPYSAFNWFRQGVCRMSCGMNIHEVWNDEESYINEPFAPFLLSYNSDTSFDYATAQHLYETFRRYLPEAKQYAAEIAGDYWFSLYTVYMDILRITAENKAVVLYR